MVKYLLANTLHFGLPHGGTTHRGDIRKSIGPLQALSSKARVLGTLAHNTLSCTALHTFSALRGASRCRTLVPDRASRAALAIATAQATVGSSPMPFKRSGLVGDGVSRVAVRISSISLACGSG